MTNLGDRVQDIITGFTGTATSHTSYLHGIDVIGVTSNDLHEGKPICVQYFEVDRLLILEEPFP